MTDTSTTSTLSSTTPVINFPIQKRETTEFTSMKEDILQTRLVITEGLNQVANGTLILSEDQKEGWRRSIHSSNEVFMKYGFPPIYFDEQLISNKSSLPSLKREILSNDAIQDI